MTYPQKTADGRTIWACCVSAIGPVCGHSRPPVCCGCGIPNRANVHVHVILSREVPGGTETTYTDAYVCAEHWTGNPREVLRWDGHEDWEIIEHAATELR